MLALSACAFCAIAAVLHLASIAAVVRRMRRFESDETEEETLEGISIVRPVCGLENFTEETLLSGFLLEYPDYEILFCVAQPSENENFGGVVRGHHPADPIRYHDPSAGGVDELGR